MRLSHNCYSYLLDIQEPSKQTLCEDIKDNAKGCRSLYRNPGTFSAEVRPIPWSEFKQSISQDATKLELGLCRDLESRVLADAEALFGKTGQYYFVDEHQSCPQDTGLAMVDIYTVEEQRLDPEPENTYDFHFVRTRGGEGEGRKTWWHKSGYHTPSEFLLDDWIDSSSTPSRYDPTGELNYAVCPRRLCLPVHRPPLVASNIE